MRNRLDAQLKKLHDELVELGDFIEMTMEKTMSAFKTNDYALAKEVYGNDDVADNLELKIEQRSLRLLLAQQPVARDLRMISTALKMITDMERICDQAKNIAEIVIRFEGQELVRKPENILLMSEKCIVMVHKCIEAFVNNDLELARNVMGLDDDVDALYRNVYDNVASLIVSQTTRTISQAVDMVMIAKYLERIADHAVNIAEWVEFSITGEHKNKVLL